MGLLSLPAALLFSVLSLACGPGASPSHCENGERDEDESDIDCGGSCGICDVGQTCYEDAACEFQCRGDRCVAAFCADGVRTEAEGETDIDCGGPSCGPCEVGRSCAEGRDCAFGVCSQDDNVCVSEACVDGIRNNEETSVDCGGQSSCTSLCGDCVADPMESCSAECTACLTASCDVCGDGASCGDGSDCWSKVCDPETNTCAGATCEDGVQNNDEESIDCGGMFCMPCHCLNGELDGNETDVDCGGGDFSSPRCPQCSDGRMCIAAEGRDDCFNSTCYGLPEAHPMAGEVPDRCIPQTCTDGEQTGAIEVAGQMLLPESDVDCGGFCQRCGADATCNRNEDCDSFNCDGGICGSPACDDGFQNGDETGIDCGGSRCLACSCSNGMRDGTETDVDCGGECSPCADGMACEEASGCVSGSCEAEICRPTECSDGVQNGDETDIDCGGGCLPCLSGQLCSTNEDCTSANCDGGSCAAPTCDDGLLNGVESDVDCGGRCPENCGLGRVCRGNADCDSGSCSGGLCVAPSCTDGLMNGDETGLDCGGDCAPCFPATCSNRSQDGDEAAVDCGGSCPGCAAGATCSTNGDCASGHCDGGACTSPRCDDGFAADNERGVDCGGVCGGVCSAGEGCLENSDCESGVCASGGRCHRGPELGFFLNRDGEVGRTITAENHTTSGDAELLAPEFDWGDGFGPRGSRNFDAPGEYEVTMRVRDTEGVEVSGRLRVRVRDFDVRFDPSTASPTVRVESGDRSIALDTSFDTATVFSPEDQAIAPESGLYYFEVEYLVAGGGDWGFGIAARNGDVGLPDAAFIGGDGNSVGVFSSGSIFHLGAFVPGGVRPDPSNPMMGMPEDANFAGMVLDYRGPALTVYVIQGGIAAPVRIDTTISEPVRIVAGGARSHIGPLLRLNTGSDTRNRSFHLDPEARLGGAVSGITMGFGGSSAGVANAAPVLSLPGPLTVAMGETVELTASATDDGEDISHAVRWENLSETYNDREVYWGRRIRFTPPTIGTHELRAQVTDADGQTTEGRVAVEVTGTLERVPTVRLEPEMRSGAGIILDTDGLRARFSESGKAAIAANQGIIDGFHYFEAQRLGGVTAQGSGLVTPFGNLNPYDQANVPWSCSAQVLGGTWKDFIRRGDWNTGTVHVGWAVDYRGDYPIAYLIVDDAVADIIEMPEIRVPVHPMIYGQPPSFSGWQWQVRFDGAMHYDAETVLRDAGVDVTGFAPSWGR